LSFLNIRRSTTEYPAKSSGKAQITFSRELLDDAKLSSEQVLQKLNTTINGLSDSEVENRIDQYGKNEVAKEKKQTWIAAIWENIKNPLVILLIGLGVISYITGDVRATIMIGIMVILGVVLRYFQETRATNSAEKLKQMVSTTASVFRDGVRKEIPLQEIVPGDIIHLSAGDMVPADVRVLTAKDLFLNQATLTGESLPVEKTFDIASEDATNPLEVKNLCFLGSNVESGTGTAVVVHTGSQTYFGALAKNILGPRVLTSFDKGINSFTWLMIGFMLILVPLVFLFNGISKNQWLEAFLFALAVAVGLTPEMLPMIVTVNLSKGALTMAKQKVIVKRLNSIQNFGAMDVLCTDKTGTITRGKIILEKHLDVSGHENDEILYYGYLNSFFQTGLKNIMDEAVIEHINEFKEFKDPGKFTKIDEIPFDFNRRRMSVIVEDDNKQRMLICKGAVEEVFKLCTHVKVKGEVLPRVPDHDAHRQNLVNKLNTEGFRVIALAYKDLSSDIQNFTYSVNEETDMVLLGFLAFLDPPKETAIQAIRELNELNVQVKILTGDNDLVTTTICKQVGLSVDHILLGSAIDELTDDQLAIEAEKVTVFAKLSPSHKEKIIHALQSRKHVVGFMGDGINDAPALKAADVGISVDSAVDIAKESSDIILLEQSLLVLADGVKEGRKVFGNIIKYIKMAASSNFGNMFSVLGASIMLPFVPMLPIQVLTNNLLYDFSQTTIPTDGVDKEWITKPRKWEIGDIRRFILFIGPISSIFDYLTYFLMMFVFKTTLAGPTFNPALFHTGWFVESLFTQTLIIHVIRTNKIPFIQSRASKALLISSLIIVGIGAYLPYSPLASALGFVPLPPIYWLYLFGMLVCYVILTQLVKTWFYKRFGN
jgi:Mg2+-importing ATPase